MKWRDKFPHLCIQRLKLPLSVCHLTDHAAQSRTLTMRCMYLFNHLKVLLYIFIYTHTKI